MKTIKLMIIAALLIVCSGCFPIFVDDDRGGHHEGRGHYDHGEDHRERGDRY